MKVIHDIHDRTFKSAMADIRVAREFFELYLPKNILSLIDLETLRLNQNSYVDEDLQSSSSDVLYQVRLKDKKIGYIYVLCEHQSSVDSLMPLRLWGYLIRIWNDIIKQTGSKHLPLVFPLVFYHGKRPYNGVRNLRDMIEAPLNLVDEVLFKDFHLIDTHKIKDEELQKQHWAGVMAFMFKHVYDRDVWPHMQAVISMMKKIEGEDRAITYINLLLKYWLRAAETKNTPKDFLETMEKGLQRPIKGGLMTLGDQLRQEGERTILTRLLERKFAEIPKPYQNKLDSANSEMLLNWVDKAVDASTIAAVFE